MNDLFTSPQQAIRNHNNLVVIRVGRINYREFRGTDINSLADGFTFLDRHSGFLIRDGDVDLVEHQAGDAEVEQDDARFTAEQHHAGHQ